MAMCDWTELEVLGRKIADAEDRLASARSTQNCGLVQLLEKEIAAATALRDRVVSTIAIGLTSQLMMPPHSLSPETSSAPPSPGPAIDNKKGVDAMWNQLSHSDIERVKCDLQARHSEMLARHAEELKSLDAEAAEIEILERAIEAFVRTFNIGGAEVVPLERPALSQAS